MIVAQRSTRPNAQTIKTQDQVLQDPSSTCADRGTLRWTA